MNATEKLTALKSCDVLANADDDTLQWLSDLTTSRLYQPGQVIFDAGESSSRVYVVASGTLEARLNAESNLVSLFEPGALFGEYAMFLNGVRAARVVAATETTLLSIDAEDFRAFLLRCPQAMIQVLQTVVRRLHRAERSRA